MNFKKIILMSAIAMAPSLLTISNLWASTMEEMVEKSSSQSKILNVSVLYFKGDIDAAKRKLPLTDNTQNMITTTQENYALNNETWCQSSFLSWELNRLAPSETLQLTMYNVSITKEMGQTLTKNTIQLPLQEWKTVEDLKNALPQEVLQPEDSTLNFMVTFHNALNHIYHNDKSGESALNSLIQR